MTSLRQGKESEVIQIRMGRRGMSQTKRLTPGGRKIRPRGRYGSGDGGCRNNAGERISREVRNGKKYLLRSRPGRISPGGEGRGSFAGRRRTGAEFLKNSSEGVSATAVPRQVPVIIRRTPDSRPRTFGNRKGMQY